MLILQLIYSCKVADLEKIEAVFDATYCYLSEEHSISVALALMAFLIDGKPSAAKSGMVKRMLAKLEMRLGNGDRNWFNLPPLSLN